ncbi:tRNA uridine(34) 5-carboxymethylaminomethyl modification radical SAM/GNAT enzyme Elp3 [Candidatus Woesearchaeota archaeon]|nr:tRNA uridine(34) 5-carboxymethylaminomethyl modification radical SAM/GNAT enzyme Elp3 [Candidatus Woesearchaeota archaeon]
MTALPDAYLARFLDFMRANEKDLSKEVIAQQKKRLCKELDVKAVPSDIAILTHLDGKDMDFAKEYLLTKPMRSQSGVTVVAIMTRPSRCPHGRCTYCPGGPGSAFGDTPQSYTGHEPATMRGMRAGYDAYVQVFNRLEQYIVGGHDPQKIELILMGGTFPHEDPAYQENFVRDAFQALNDFSSTFYADGNLLLDSFKDFFQLPGSVKDDERVKKIQENIISLKQKNTPSLEEVHSANETAQVRCVGLTIETRPSHGKLAHGNELLKLGCTRVELGIQTLHDDVLEAVHRDHTVQDSIESIADLRDLGFKLNFHIMLGLPGMTADADRKAAEQLFTNPDFQPDMLKLYPCMVMEGTPLYNDFKAGKFTPITTEDAAKLIADIMKLIPRYCRVMRVQRDIPTKVTEAGVDKTNLRQLVDARMEVQNVTSQDIRAREIRDRPIKKAVLNVIGYEASGGEEFFISIDDPEQDAIIGFCRLRFPPRQLRDEFDVRTAIIRELHIYGKQAGIGVVGIEGSAQHKGFGSQLMHVAERIAREHGKEKLLVISGVGVREYYRKLGYERDGPYMGKKLKA